VPGGTVCATQLALGVAPPDIGGRIDDIRAKNFAERLSWGFVTRAVDYIAIKSALFVQK